MNKKFLRKNLFETGIKNCKEIYQSHEQFSTPIITRNIGQIPINSTMRFEHVHRFNDSNMLSALQSKTAANPMR